MAGETLARHGVEKHKLKALKLQALPYFPRTSELCYAAKRGLPFRMTLALDRLGLVSSINDNLDKKVIAT